MMTQTVPANEWIHASLHEVADDLTGEPLPEIYREIGDQPSDKILPENGVVSPTRHDVTNLDWAMVFRQIPEREHSRMLDGNVATQVQFEIEMHACFSVVRNDTSAIQIRAKTPRDRARKSGRRPKAVQTWDGDQSNRDLGSTRANTRRSAEKAIYQLNRMCEEVVKRLGPVGGTVEAEFDEGNDRGQQIAHYLSRYLVISVPPMILQESA